MWFVFPQLDGLGHSPTARHYAIRSLEHARTYASDPLLGSRLRECCRALLALPAALTAEQVLGSVDAMKLRSSMTLFGRATERDGVFGEVLTRFYAGAEDDATVSLLQSPGG